MIAMRHGVWSFWPALHLVFCLACVSYVPLLCNVANKAGQRRVSCTKTQITAVSCMQSRSLVRCCLLLHSVLLLFSPAFFTLSTRPLNPNALLRCALYRYSTGCSRKWTQTEPLCAQNVTIACSLFPSCLFEVHNYTGCIQLCASQHSPSYHNDQ